jgi:hypothetical protein
MRDNSKCGICGKDLFQTPATTLSQAVQDQEKIELLATAELKRKELSAARKKIYEKILGWLVTSAVLILGFLLLTTTPPGSLPDIAGYVLFALGAIMFAIMLGPYRGRAGVLRTRI